MDIRVTSTGKIFYKVDPLLGGLLLEALPASFERLDNKSASASAPVNVEFSIQREIGTGLPYIRVFCPRCQRTESVMNPAVYVQPKQGLMFHPDYKKKSPAAWAEEVAHSLDGRLCVHAGGKDSRVPDTIRKAFVKEFDYKG